MRNEGVVKDVSFKCGRNLERLSARVIVLAGVGERRVPECLRKMGPIMGRQAQITPTTTSTADQVKMLIRPPLRVVSTACRRGGEGEGTYCMRERSRDFLRRELESRDGGRLLRRH